MYDLPSDIINSIYAFDNTYYEIYNDVMISLRLINFYKELIEKRKKNIKYIQLCVSRYTNICSENDKHTINTLTNVLNKNNIKKILLELDIKKKQHHSYYHEVYNIWGNLYINYINYKYDLNHYLNEIIF